MSFHKISDNNTYSFTWNTEWQTAFDELKTDLTRATIPLLPDFNKSLDTDESTFSIGALLSKFHRSKEILIAYASKVRSKKERQYYMKTKSQTEISTLQRGHTRLDY